MEKPNAHLTNWFWGLDCVRGAIHHGGNAVRWDGQWKSGKLSSGDVVVLLLDCDAGTLSVKLNGRRLGVAATGLTGEFCWAVCSFDDEGAEPVRIAAADATAF